MFSPESYSVWPSVVPSGKQCEVVISANEPAFMFWSDRSYRLVIYPIQEDITDYHAPLDLAEFTLSGESGVLRFTHVFEGEQEFLLELFEGDNLIAKLRMYSLFEDLFPLQPLKGDLHSHSFRSDGSRDPAALAGYYRQAGYDFFALTDHNRYAPGAEILDAYSGVELGLTLLRGEEVHVPGSVIHIVHVGGDQSVADIYVKHGRRLERELGEVYARLPSNVSERFAERYVKSMWACERIHAAGGIAIFPHPYWRPYGHNYNVIDPLNELLLTSGMFDAYELVGGMKTDGNNLSVMHWCDLKAKGLKISVVGSSDQHKLESKHKEFNNLYTIAFAADNTSEAILDAVRQGRTVAVEACGEGESRQYRCYGEYRLCSLAQFMIKYYFPRTAELCYGEGVLMRRYLMGEVNGSRITDMSGDVADFYARFYGLKDPILPRKPLLEYEQKWRNVQLQGPLTKGSSIQVYGKNSRQI